MERNDAVQIPLENILSHFGIDAKLSTSMKCFLHNDKNPSAQYDRKSNKFSCHACGIMGGTTIDVVGNLLGKYPNEKQGFIEIMKYFEEHFGNGKGIESMPKVNIDSNKADKADNDKIHLVPDDKINKALLKLGKGFTKDYRGINKDILNTAGLRHDFRGLKVEDLIPFLRDLKLLEGKTQAESISYLKGCGILTDRGSLSLDGFNILIPYFVNEKVQTIQGTMGRDDKPKYYFMRGLEKSLFNADILKGMKEGDELYVQEGVFDTLSLVQMGLKAVGLPGVHSFPKYKELLAPFKIVTFLDNDEDGRKLGSKLIHSGLNVNVYQWKGKPDKYDVNAFIQEKAGATLEDILGQVETYRAAGEVAATGNVERFFIDKIEKHFEDCRKINLGDISGYRLKKYPLLEKGIDGIQDGLFMIAGNTNIGKTGFLVNLTLDLLESNEGLKVLYYSIDDSTGKILNRIYANLGNIRLIESNKNTNDKDKEARKRFVFELLKEWVKAKRFEVIDTESVDSVDGLINHATKNKAEQMAIVIDGVNYLTCGKKEGLEADKYLSNELKKLSTALKCPVIMTCELRKMIDAKNMTAEKYSTREIFIEDIKGSSTLPYKADLTVSLSFLNNDDWEKDEADFQLLILKNKWSEKKGRLRLMFNKPYCQITEKEWISSNVKKDNKKNDNSKNGTDDFLEGLQDDNE